MMRPHLSGLTWFRNNERRTTYRIHGSFVVCDLKGVYVSAQCGERVVIATRASESLSKPTRLFTVMPETIDTDPERGDNPGVCYLLP